jgi:hypothetical protein
MLLDRSMEPSSQSMGETYEATVRIVLAAAGMYVAVGTIFAFFFAAFGAGRIDDAAKESGVTFRLIIIPGTIALWPVLARKWIRDSARNRRT